MGSAAQSEASKKVFTQLLRTINLIALERIANTINDENAVVPANPPPAEPQAQQVGTAFKLRKKLIEGDSLTKLLQKLMDIIRDVAEESEFAEGADTAPELVNEALQLISAILVSSGPCLQAFVKRQDLPNWLVALVLKSRHHLTREYGAKGLSSLATRIAENSYGFYTPYWFYLHLLIFLFSV